MMVNYITGWWYKINVSRRCLEVIWLTSENADDDWLVVYLPL